MTANAQDRGRDLHSRMAVAEERLENLDVEQQRHRERLHALEAAGAAVQLLVTNVSYLRQDLTRGMDTLRNELQAFTTDRIRTAVDAAFTKHGEQTSKAWDTRTKVLMVLIAAAGWLTAVAQLPDPKPQTPQIVTVTTLQGGGTP